MHAAFARDASDDSARPVEPLRVGDVAGNGPPSGLASTPFRVPDKAKPSKQKNPPSREDQLQAPSREAQALIRRHLAGEHQIRRFRLSEHVYLGAPRRESQHISWDPGKATFHCDLCPGVVFSTGEVTPERILIEQLFNPNLQPHLTGLHTQDERDEMTAYAISGDLNRARLDAAAAAALREATAHSRHMVAARREWLQEWMLARYAELGVVARVIEAAEALQHDDDALWKKHVGRSLVATTIRQDYWDEIPKWCKARAKRAFEQSKRKRREV